MRRSSDAGQAIVIVALAFTALMLAAGIGIDMGYLRYQKRLQQSAADSAAIAGAAEVYYGDVTAAADTDSASNGFTNGINNVTVTVYNPPNDGPHAAMAGYVEVLVTKIQPTFFMRVAGVNNATVTARAVAYGGSNGSACVYVLDPTGVDALITGANQITAQCGMIVDSNSADAVDMTGSNTINDAFTGIVGGDALTGTNVISPAPVTGIVPAPDPLAYLDNSEPSITAYTPCSGATYPGITGAGQNVTITPGSSCYSVSVTGANNTVTLQAGNYGNVSVAGSGNNVTLGPGNYGTVGFVGANNTVTLGAGDYGSVSITGTGTLTFNAGQYGSITGTGAPNEIFNAGLYVITSGGLVLTGTNGLTSTGATFYLGPNAGSVDITGANSTNLTAPTSGTYAGILFFQNPLDTNTVTVTGASGTIYNGAFYFPNAGLTWTGSNSSLSLYTILVAKDIDLTGANNLTFNANYSSLPEGSPIKKVTLVE
jgi:hypothetical protein